jgi:type I restriction enzyme R subunit
MTPLTPEQIARTAIDGQLAQAGWTVQSRNDMNVAASLGVAVREFPTDAGPCDYLLFIAGKPAGVIEAKRQGVALTSVEAQTRDYAGSLPDWLAPPVRPLPFLYESTGAETRFTNLLDPTPRSRPVFNFHQPATLQSWSDAAVAIQRNKPGAPIAPTLLGRLRHAPPLTHSGLWEPQFRALAKLEASIRDGRPRALVQMATGAGKTLTAVAALYRLIKFGGARRVLFLVDRGNLGRQALREFQGFDTPDDGFRRRPRQRAFAPGHTHGRPTAHNIRSTHRRCQRDVFE